MNPFLLVKIFSVYDTFGKWTYVIVFFTIYILIKALKKSILLTSIILLLIFYAMYLYEPAWFDAPPCGMSENEYLQSFKVRDTIKLFK